ncbi:MAG: hypothetical protein Q7V19_15590 [Bacteroidales bacterium]|nr:hypothetical protein [Bacteroidales bacterium]
MRRLLVILVFIILTSTQTIFACDCDSQGAFLTVAPKTDLVALVKLIRYLSFLDINDMPTPNSMEVEIIEIFKGQEKRKTIIVWGDNGNLCRPYLNIFEIGNNYVIAFDRGSEMTEIKLNQDLKTDYSISNCGDYWLHVDIDKQIAKGTVTDKQNEIRLKDLKNKLWTK